MFVHYIKNFIFLLKILKMKNLLFILILLFTFNSVKATHLMGGEITWKCIKSGVNQGAYVFNVKIYRDCNGVPVQNLQNKFLVLHNHLSISNIALTYMGSADISPICNGINGPNVQLSCGSPNSGYGGSGNGSVEEHIFRSDTIEISGNPDSLGWHFTYTDNARNLAVINLANNTGQYGFTLRAVIYSYTDSLGVIYPNNNECYDSSPKFYEKPRTILEVGNGYDPLAFSNGFTYSHNAFDEEQDSISYNWGQPLDGYNAPTYDYLDPDVINGIPFASGFSINAPVQGILMNSITGRTEYPASNTGNYVTCTNVSAYKCGQLVSEIFRELQVVLIPPTCNLGDTTNGNIGADSLCNVRPLVQPPFFYPANQQINPWDTLVHCGDTVKFDFNALDNDVYPNGSQQDLLFEVSGGQFFDYFNNIPCQNPPCATFNEIGTGTTPPFITAGGVGSGEFEWITSCNHIINSCGSTLTPKVYTFVIKVSDDFCPAPAIENTSQVISITVFPPCSNLKIPTSTNSVTNCLINNGNAQVSPYGGTAPYISYWADMNGLPVNPNSLSVGDYVIRVTDSTNCEAVDTVTILGPNLPSNTFSSVNVSCYGGNDGSITSVQSGGQAPYSYLWSNGSTSQSIFNLVAGTYTLSVVDANNCEVIDVIVITESPQMQNTFVLTPSACLLNNGVAQILTSGGMPPYVSSWTDINGIPVNPNSLAMGDYIVIVTDSIQCEMVDTITITGSSSLPSNTFSSVSVSCYGGNDGSITSVQSGGQAPYSYLWSNGSTSQSIFNLIAGTYTLSVVDANNCEVIDVIVITESPQIFPSMTNINGVITGSASGGAAPYNYQFFGPNGLLASSSSNFGNNFSINPVVSGLYTFVVIDANGCTDSNSINFALNFSPTVVVTLSNNDCDSLTDLTIMVSQDSGEVDMSTALFQSNAGYFDIASMNVGDTIGTSTLIAGGGFNTVNSTLVVVSTFGSTQAIIESLDITTGIALGNFTITNLNQGVSVSATSIPDNNNYTNGNMSSVTFNNIFVNPCVPLIFTSTINSELGDIDVQIINFTISFIKEVDHFNILIHPNPSNGKIVLEMNNVIAGNYLITIRNLLGQNVYDKNVKIQGVYKTNIDFSRYGTGTYFLSVSNINVRITKKLIVE